MNSVQIKNIVLGEGVPKICAPLVETDYDSLIREAGSFPALPVDVAEWRADWYQGILEQGAAARVLPGLRNALGPIPLLFTFRTHAEGGNLPADLRAYRMLLEQAVCSGAVDLVDIELFSDEHLVMEMIRLAHEHQVKVVLSNHDFTATPDEKELLKRLERMDFLGADVAKIAVMPGCADDVLTLLSATQRASRTLSCPIISMSMKGTGLVSRFCGEVFGSCLTFGSVREASAPGQIHVTELKQILETIHASLQTGQSPASYELSKENERFLPS